MLRHTITALALSPAVALLLTTGAGAQDTAKPQRYPEPEVRKIVVEDDNARIDELRVRGVTRNITVHPKKGGPNYQIEPIDPAANPANSVGGARLEGRRVWNVLAF